MTIILAIIGIVVFGITFWIAIDDNSPEIVIIGFLALAFTVPMFFNISTIVNGRIIDQKIEMYQEENDNIEEDIDILVENYMEHEKKITWSAEGGSPVTLINLYPDLKADELVQEQIRIYTENNNKIRELKEEKLEITTAKFWLYFGG